MYPVRDQKPFSKDLSGLLKPISADSATGESLRYEGTYDEIRDARKEDDSDLTRGVWVSPLKRADWTKVESICIKALENRSKDLQIGVWLVEAWVHRYGFAGLHAGLQMLAALCNAFWDDIYPQLDGDDLEYRLAPFIWLNEKLPVEVKLVPLTSPDSDDARVYCWADWEGANRSPESDTSSQDNSQAAFQQSVMLTPAGFYSALYSSVSGCVETCAELRSILEKHCGAEAPTLGHISRSIAQIRDYLSGVLEQRHIPQAASAAEQAAEAQTNSALNAGVATGGSGNNSGPIRSRSEAYQRLAEAADFLARTEPHSPAPYLIRRAIKWGSMQLTDLLPELVRNSSELSEIYRLLQMPDR